MRQVPKENAPKEFLELFFPIHYTIGMTVEDTLRSNVLTRQQTIILWLIHSKGENRRSMSRKDIVKALSYWFDLTSSAISKALRSLAKAPLGLVNITEDPNSGREKIVTLTSKGQKFLLQMMANGQALVKRLTDVMTQDEIDQGINFFQRVSEIFETEIEQKRDLPGASIGRPSVKKSV